MFELAAPEALPEHAGLPQPGNGVFQPVTQPCQQRRGFAEHGWCYETNWCWGLTPPQENPQAAVTGER